MARASWNNSSHLGLSRGAEGLKLGTEFGCPGSTSGLPMPAETPPKWREEVNHWQRGDRLAFRPGRRMYLTPTLTLDAPGQWQLD